MNWKELTRQSPPQNKESPLDSNYWEDLDKVYVLGRAARVRQLFTTPQPAE